MIKKKTPRTLPKDAVKHHIIAVRVTSKEYRELRFALKQMKVNYMSTMLRKLGLEAAALERAKV